MTNAFRAINNNLKDSPVIVIAMLFALAGGVIATILYGEDLYSSYMALKIMQEKYGVVTPAQQAVFFALSALPQVGSTLMGWTFMTDTTKKWHLLGGGALELADFMADLYYRTNEWELWHSGMNYLENGGDSDPLTGLIFAIVITFAISVFSIFLFVLSWGIVLEGFEDTIVQFARAFSKTRAALIKARKTITDAQNETNRRP